MDNYIHLYISKTSYVLYKISDNYTHTTTFKQTNKIIQQLPNVTDNYTTHTEAHQLKTHVQIDNFIFD